MCLAGYHGPIQRYCDLFYATTGRKAVYKVSQVPPKKELKEVGGLQKGGQLLEKMRIRIYCVEISN